MVKRKNKQKTPHTYLSLFMEFSQNLPPTSDMSLVTIN